jgi:hypothetical protein
MARADQLILAAVAGAVAMLCLCILFDDLKMAAHAAERMTCRDEPDRKAYMARLPGEAHSVESCIQAMRFGDPRWVPELGHPLKPRKEK